MNTSNIIFKNIFSSVFSFLEGIVKTVFSSFVFKKGCNLRTFYRIFSAIIEYIKFIQIDNKQPYGSRKSSRQDVYPKILICFLFPVLTLINHINFISSD